MDWTKRLMDEVRADMLDRLDGAAMEVLGIWREKLSAGKVEDDTLSPYGRSQRYRRQKKGRQTSVKDLNYSGTLTGSVKEVGREVGEDYIEVQLGFTGQAHRRRDQTALTNEQLADYLSLQQRSGKAIFTLSDTDKQQIEQKYGVKINLP